MSEYVLENFSDSLTQKDILELFKKLHDSTGSLAKAADLCKIERKTVYDWRETGYVKLLTKRRVLRALLKHLTETTLSFITRRSYERALDAFRVYLYTLYERSVSESDPNRFRQQVDEIQKAIREYKGLAWYYSKKEIPDILYELSQHAREIGENWRPIHESEMSRTDLAWTGSIDVLALSFCESSSAMTDYAGRKATPLTSAGSETEKLCQSLWTLRAETFVRSNYESPVRIDQLHSTAATTEWLGQTAKPDFFAVIPRRIEQIVPLPTNS